jgi:pyruvate formate lyase activating enzyme
MLQIDFLERTVAWCKQEGIHCAVDTAGNLPWAYFRRLLAFAPMFLYDVKAADPQVHKRLTGVDNGRIVDNLRRLSQAGARLWIRVPFVPGLNDMEMEGIAALCAEIRAERCEVMGYHRLGESKYTALGLTNEKRVTPPDSAALEAVRGTFLRHGIHAHI